MYCFRYPLKETLDLKITIYIQKKSEKLENKTEKYRDQESRNNEHNATHHHLAKNIPATRKQSTQLCHIS